MLNFLINYKNKKNQKKLNFKKIVKIFKKCYIYNVKEKMCNLCENFHKQIRENSKEKLSNIIEGAKFSLQKGRLL